MTTETKSILDRFRLDGRVALVTGASRGIGRALAQALAEAGARAALVARGAEALEKAADEIARSTGNESVPLVCDLAEPDAAERLVAGTIERFGRLDILVNNAGLTTRHPAEEYPMEEWDRVLAVDLRAVFALCQQAGRVMIRQGGGKIINIASLASEMGIKIVPAYCAAKGGVRSLTMQLAVEWAKHDIQVNGIGPGYILTDLTASLKDDPERNDTVLRRTPAGRWGTPEDLMGACVFLASDAANFMTGQILYVDGGWLAG